MAVTIETFALLILTISSFTLVQIDAKLIEEPKCITEGLSCIDCWTAVNCIDLGDGEFFPQIQTCPLGKSCKYSTGLCADTGTYDCSNTEKVQCHNEGIFPNPYDCRKYFICVRGKDNMWEKHENECTGSYYFDPFRKQCSKKLAGNASCTSPVGICKDDTQMYSVNGNPSLFYQCERENVTIGFNYLPHLYACPNNFQFNSTQRQCIDPSPIGINENGKCIAKDTYANPSNCAAYTICNGPEANPDNRFCSSAYRFDPMTKVCVPFNCASCYAPV